MGYRAALLEDSAMDHSLGRYLSKNLAHFVDEYDEHASAIGARGIGELGAVGVGAAIANAVHHATGVRIREVPIRPEMLLA